MCEADAHNLDNTVNLKVIYARLITGNFDNVLCIYKRLGTKIILRFIFMISQQLKRTSPAIMGQLFDECFFSYFLVLFVLNGISHNNSVIHACSQNYLSRQQQSVEVNVLRVGYNLMIERS